MPTRKAEIACPSTDLAATVCSPEPPDSPEPPEQAAAVAAVAPIRPNFIASRRPKNETAIRTSASDPKAGETRASAGPDLRIR